MRKLTLVAGLVLLHVVLHQPLDLGLLRLRLGEEAGADDRVSLDHLVNNPTGKCSMGGVGSVGVGDKKLAQNSACT